MNGKKIGPVLALAVAAAGIGLATQTGSSNVTHATLVHDSFFKGETPYTFKANWLGLNGRQVGTYSVPVAEGDVLTINSIELPKGYRLATLTELNDADLDYPDINVTHKFYVGYNNYTITGFVVPTAKAVKADYKIAYKGVVKTKKTIHTYTFGTNYALKKGKALKKSSSWKTSQLLSVKGALYYGIGGGQWVKASEVAIQKIGVGHINYNKHYGIQIWNAKHGIIYDKYGHARKLKGQTNWKAFGTATIKGKKYYNLGINQFMEAKYVSLHK